MKEPTGDTPDPLETLIVAIVVWSAATTEEALHGLRSYAYEDPSARLSIAAELRELRRHVVQWQNRPDARARALEAARTYERRARKLVNAVNWYQLGMAGRRGMAPLLDGEMTAILALAEADPTSQLAPRLLAWIDLRADSFRTLAWGGPGRGKNGNAAARMRTLTVQALVARGEPVKAACNAALELWPVDGPGEAANAKARRDKRRALEKAAATRARLVPALRCELQDLVERRVFAMRPMGAPMSLSERLAALDRLRAALVICGAGAIE